MHLRNSQRRVAAAAAPAKVQARHAPEAVCAGRDGRRQRLRGVQRCLPRRRFACHGWFQQHGPEGAHAALRCFRIFQEARHLQTRAQRLRAQAACCASTL